MVRGDLALSKHEGGRFQAIYVDEELAGVVDVATAGYEGRPDPEIQVIGSAVQVNNPDAVAFWGAVGYQRVSGPSLQPDGTTTYLLAKKRPPTP
jgi:hypothetical protein